MGRGKKDYTRVSMNQEVKLVQSMSEYAVLVVLVISAVMAMQLYVKRTLQGRVAAASGILLCAAVGKNPAGVSGGSIAACNAHFEPYYVSRPDYRSSSLGNVGDESGRTTIISKDGGLKEQEEAYKVTNTVEKRKKAFDVNF